MKTQTLRCLVFFTLIFSLCAPAAPVQAAGLVVNSLADTVLVDSKCTLREAIQNANNNAATNADCAAGTGADTISFSLSGTITLGSALPTINDSAGLTIDGAGQSLTISGNNLVHLITVNGLVPLVINELTLANGYTEIYGAAIENYGTLTITNSVFSGNHNNAYDGGAIYSQSSTVNIDQTTFSGNSAVDEGGGIYLLGGTVTVSNSAFSSNTAFEGGGIFSYDCTLIVDQTTFSGNNTPNGSGGGIYSVYGPLTITNSAFAGNGASYGSGGGGVYNRAGTLSVTNTTFAGNSATGSPGGGVYNDATMNLSKTTFTDNSAGSGGGVYADDDNSTIANSTFKGNSASASGANGGAIFNTGGLIISNSTLSGNSVTGGSSAGGVANSGGTLTLRNTIVANNSGGNCSGTISNGASNIDDGVTCGWGSANGSLSGTNPMLGALTGAPAYFPLNLGSPAIDKGDDSICAAWPVSNQSQNGVTRPQGAHCDSGSFEIGDVVPPAVTNITRADANPTSAASIHFIVTFSEAVTGVNLSDFSLSVSGVTGAGISGVSGGGASYTVTVNTGNGVGTIRLDAVDDDTILDQSANPLGGAGIGNGNFSSGQVYQVRYPQTYLPAVFKE